MVVGFPESVSSRGSESLQQEDWASCRASGRWTFHLQGVEKKKGEVGVGDESVEVRKDRRSKGWSHGFERVGLVNFVIASSGGAMRKKD